MNTINSKLIKIIFIITIILTIFNIKSYGISSNSNVNSNNTNNNVASNSANNKVVSNNANSSAKSNNTTVTNSEKSSNANLSNLGISPNDFSGFSESKTSYSVSVPNSVKQVEVYATKKDNKATVTGTGNKQLKEGENVVDVVVTAEDGTTKTYTINIKRLSDGETAVDANNSNLGLSELNIEGLNLEPNFSTDNYKYTVKLKGDISTLNITANANEKDAEVEIMGNENLVDGQNIITILVTNKKETQSTVYRIYVDKNFVEQDEVNKQLDETQSSVQIKEWIIKILIFIVIIGIIAILIIRHKKMKNLGLYEDEENEKDNDNYELIKGLNYTDYTKSSNSKGTKKHKRKHGK